MRLTTMRLHSLDIDAHGTAAAHFRPPRPLRYRAGQHGLWHIPGGGVHPFTVASAPEEELVTLGTGLGSGSRLKRAIRGLSVGDPVRLLGPVGHFTIPASAPSTVMIAQGMGVTPFRSMLRHISLADMQVRTTLLHVGAAHPFRGDTEPLASRSIFADSRHAFDTHLPGVLDPSAFFLVSGSPAFVSATTSRLTALGIERARISSDKFWGYQSGPAPAEHATA